MDRLPVQLALSLLLLIQSGCASLHSLDRAETRPRDFGAMPSQALDHLRTASPFLKIHLPDGGVYVLGDWALDRAQQHIEGRGVRLGAMRDTLQRWGPVRVSLDSVALVETNSLVTSKVLAPLAIMTGITAAVAVYCIQNPKACFGSCPTFYVPDGDSLRLSAEGFSASIAPALEATDVDALFQARPAGDVFPVEMRNEALETHVVRHVDLLVAPRALGHRVLAALDGSFRDCDNLLPPRRAMGPEGDCTWRLARPDGVERFSLADSNDLAATETLTLEFPPLAADSVGLVVGCRQTLLSTYLLYQTFAYMGNEAGRWLASAGRSGFDAAGRSMEQMLTGIDVERLDSSGAWRPVHRLREFGPLAEDFHLVPLPRGPRDRGTPVRIRLRMTRGAWRLDYVALARLGPRVTPIRLQPFEVDDRAGRPDAEARESLRDEKRALTTLPGDRYTLRFRLPRSSTGCELFLESRGYYLEWIRSEWIAEEDPYYLRQILFDPDAALRRLAPAFKRTEAVMEDQFWKSRYARP